ncbi:MAG TPA: carbohydrate kinase family protein [Anaerolineaceae bacterium]
MTIVCTGSIAYDYLMTFPGYFKDHILVEHLDSISLSFLVDSMVRQRGGTAPNIAYSLALLGENPLLFGTVGEDFGDYRVWLENQGIDTSGVAVIPGLFTASFFANTDRSNAQICSFYPGAMAQASSLSLKQLVKKPDLVIISPNDPGAMYKLVDECIELGIPYLYDPSQQLIRMERDEIRRGVLHAQSLFVNEYEFELLQKHSGLTPEIIQEHLQYLVITRGERGASIYAGGSEIRVAVVPPKQILDPTGVGDAFRSGFVRGVRLGLDWKTCGQMGALAATYVLEQKGTQNHAYTINEFIQRYAENFGDAKALESLLN